MTLRSFPAVAACAAWLAAGPALAQHEPPRVQMRPPAPKEAPTPLAPAVVEGTTLAALKRQTQSFVQALATPSPRVNRLTRWDAPVCVAVAGLVPAQAAEVKARVEEVANALKVGVARPGCNPTIEIFFADDPQGLLDRVANTREDLLGYWHSRDRQTLKTVSRPVQAWYVTATTGGAGGGAGLAFAYMDRAEASSGVATQQIHGEVIDDPDVAPPTGCGDSRFTNCMKSVFNHVMVVVDNNRVRDYSPGVIADYAVMLAFAQPRSLDTCNALPSVLDLFACRRPDPVKGLTRADVTYLTGLYSANPESASLSEESDIANRMADMLLKDRLAVQTGGGRPAAR